MDIFRTRVDNKIRLFIKDETPFAVRRRRTGTKIVGAYRDAQGHILVTYSGGITLPISRVNPWHAAFNAAIDYFWASTPRVGNWIRCEGGIANIERPGAIYRVHEGRLEVARSAWGPAYGGLDALQAWQLFYPET